MCWQLSNNDFDKDHQPNCSSPRSDDGIKPGVGAAKPRDRTKNFRSPQAFGSGSITKSSIVTIRLTAAPRADYFDVGSRGFAALHPRLYAVVAPELRPSQILIDSQTIQFYNSQVGPFSSPMQYV